MISYDYLTSGEVSWIKFGILSLLFGLILSFTDPIRDFKFKDLFASKSDFLRLAVLIILGQVIALMLFISTEINAFVVLLLASILAFIGSHRNRNLRNDK